MKQSKIILPAAAVLLTLGVTLHTSLAYFTTYATARGTRPVAVQTQQTQPTQQAAPTMTETFGDWTKHVVIHAGSGASPVFVRAKAFSSQALTVQGNEKWKYSESDGFYYANEPIADNGAGYSKDTAALDIKIAQPSAESAQPDAQFDVIVVYEYTAAITGTDGKLYADWTQTHSVGGDS